MHQSIIHAKCLHIIFSLIYMVTTAAVQEKYMKDDEIIQKTSGMQ